MFQGLDLLLMIRKAGLPAVRCLVFVPLVVTVKTRLLDVQLRLEGLQVFPFLIIHV